MTKLIWSRGYTADPARVRTVEDFSCPDPVVIRSAKPLKKRKPKTWQQLQERKRRKQAQKDAAKLQKVPAKPAKVAKPKGRRNDLEQALEATERKAKRAAHNEHYLAIAASKKREMASKKKSHRQVWAEKTGILGVDRTSLREKLRSTLLRKKADI